MVKRKKSLLSKIWASFRKYIWLITGIQNLKDKKKLKRREKLLNKHKSTSDKINMDIHLRVSLQDIKLEMYNRRYLAQFNKINNEPDISDDIKVTILAVTNRPTNLQNIVDNIQKQIYANLEVIILLNSSNFDMEIVNATTRHIKGVKIINMDEKLTLADCLNHGFEQSSGDWIAKFDDDDYYGAHYIADLIVAIPYSNAEILGKKETFGYLVSQHKTYIRHIGETHKQVPWVRGGTMFIKRCIFEKIKFTPVFQGTDSIYQKECLEQGIIIYASDPFNFLQVRHIDKTQHTWRISDTDYLKSLQFCHDGLAIDKVLF